MSHQGEGWETVRLGDSAAEADAGRLRTTVTSQEDSNAASN